MNKRRNDTDNYLPRPTADDGHVYVDGDYKDDVHGKTYPVNLCLKELHTISSLCGVLYVFFIQPIMHEIYGHDSTPATNTAPSEDICV